MAWVDVVQGSVGVRLCVGSAAVPLQEFIADEDPKTRYFSLSRGGPSWLMKAMGYKWNDKPPADSVIEEIITHVTMSRGKRNRAFTKVDTKGDPMHDHIVITVRGFDIGVRNSLKNILIEGSDRNMGWLIDELKKDMAADPKSGDDQVAGHDENITPLSDPEEEDHRKSIIELQAEKEKDQGFNFAPSLNAYLVRAKGAAAGSPAKQTVFTIRHKAKVRSWGSHRREMEWQRRRAIHFTTTNEVLPNQPLSENEGEADEAKQFVKKRSASSISS